MSAEEITPPRMTPEEMDRLHVDQAPYRSQYADRDFMSCYTPHGIRQIEGQYCRRIMNINRRIAYFINMQRVKGVYKNKRTGEFEDYYGLYVDVESRIDPAELYAPDRRFQSLGDLKIVYEGGAECKLHYGVSRWPHYDFITGREDPVRLREEIVTEPHLHDKIKENLLQNLDNAIGGK